jgi:hypothetical protein
MAALIGRFNKTPLERREMRFDYSNWLCDRETLRNFNPEVVPIPVIVDEVEVLDLAPLTVDTVLVTSPTTAIMFVQGGTEGFQYRIRLLALTSASQLKEDGVLFNITSGVSA